MTAPAQPDVALSALSARGQRPPHATILGWLVLLLVAGSLLRLGLWAVYGPVAYPDTGTYMVVAKSILAGDFTEYEGRRPPGYPLVLALAGLSPDRAWAIQSLMGLATSVLLFYVVFTLTRSPGVAALGGMTYNANLSQLFFEANLLAETTATFAITLVVAVFLACEQRLRDKRRVWRWGLVLGLIAAFATLTRPQFIFLPLLLAVLIGYAAYREGARVWSSAGWVGLTCLTSTVLILGWCWFNYAKVGYFTISTQTGIYLMDHTLAFIELAPDRYATIRDIYVRHRDQKLARRGLHNAVWEGLPEAMAATGLSLPALSKQFAHMSVEMFARHPVRYAGGVVRAWVDFWPAPIYWQPAMLRNLFVGQFLRVAWRLEQPMLRLANAIFLVLVAVVALSPALRQLIHWDLGLSTLASVVLITSVVQAVGIWAENARYAIPVQPLVIVIILSVAVRWLDALVREGRPSR
jgi:hypothetical protein